MRLENAVNKFVKLAVKGAEAVERLADRLSDAEPSAPYFPSAQSHMMYERPNVYIGQSQQTYSSAPPPYYASPSSYGNPPLHNAFVGQHPPQAPYGSPQPHSAFAVQYPPQAPYGSPPPHSAFAVQYPPQAPYGNQPLHNAFVSQPPSQPVYTSPSLQQNRPQRTLMEEQQHRANLLPKFPFKLPNGQQVTITREGPVERPDLKYDNIRQCPATFGMIRGIMKNSKFEPRVTSYLPNDLKNYLLADVGWPEDGGPLAITDDMMKKVAHTYYDRMFGIKIPQHENLSLAEIKDRIKNPPNTDYLTSGKRAEYLRFNGIPEDAPAMSVNFGPPPLGSKGAYQRNELGIIKRQVTYGNPLA